MTLELRLEKGTNIIITCICCIKKKKKVRILGHSQFYKIFSGSLTDRRSPSCPGDAWVSSSPGWFLPGSLQTQTSHGSSPASSGSAGTAADSRRDRCRWTHWSPQSLDTHKKQGYWVTDLRMFWPKRHKSPRSQFRSQHTHIQWHKFYTEIIDCFAPRGASKTIYKSL